MCTVRKREREEREREGGRYGSKAGISATMHHIQTELWNRIRVFSFDRNNDLDSNGVFSISTVSVVASETWTSYVRTREEKFR